MQYWEFLIFYVYLTVCVCVCVRACVLANTEFKCNCMHLFILVINQLDAQNFVL